MPQGPLDQPGIDMYEGEIVLDHDSEPVAGQQSLLAVEGGVDDVAGVDPFVARRYARTADTRGVEEVLNVAVEAVGLLLDALHEREQAGARLHFGCPRQDRCRAEDGGQR